MAACLGEESCGSHRPALALLIPGAGPANSLSFCAEGNVDGSHGDVSVPGRLISSRSCSLEPEKSEQLVQQQREVPLSSCLLALTLLCFLPAGLGSGGIEGA